MSYIKTSLALSLICRDRSKWKPKSTENPGQALHVTWTCKHLISFLNDKTAKAKDCKRLPYQILKLVFYLLLLFIVVLFIFILKSYLFHILSLQVQKNLALYCKCNYHHVTNYCNVTNAERYCDTWVTYFIVILRAMNNSFELSFPLADLPLCM